MFKYKVIPCIIVLILGLSMTYADTTAVQPGLQASAVKAVHHRGQTFVTWKEVDNPILPDAPTGKQFHDLLKIQAHRIEYRVYKAREPIVTLDGLTPVGSAPALSGWNRQLWGIHTDTSDLPLHRYVIPGSETPLPAGIGVWIDNPPWPGAAYYAITVVIDGIENRSITPANAMADPIMEAVGAGEPILQRVETPELFMGVTQPSLVYYTRWEAPPNAGAPVKAFDYLVGIPPALRSPAPVGIHMHCWGGSLVSGYTRWSNAGQGAILLASNADPYDWWTGYHEALLSPAPPKTAAQWQGGVVRPYTTERLFSFLYWLRQNGPWPIDLYRTFTAGSSMGGSGSLMTGIRNSGRVAWVRSNVGIHVPGDTTVMKPAYEAVYGKPEYGVRFHNEVPVWDYYNDVWFLKNHPAVDMPFMAFSNAKNDPLIDWPQAVRFYEALQETRQPHLFVWGQEGHSQEAVMPLSGTPDSLPMDLAVNRSLPAFTRCSLDDVPGSGDPGTGDPQGQINGYLYWLTDTLTDTPRHWEITVGLTDAAPKGLCTADITPRRLQQFKVQRGMPVLWENRDLSTGKIIASGSVLPDADGLITLPQIQISKQLNRISIRQ